MAASKEAVNSIIEQLKEQKHLLMSLRISDPSFFGDKYLEGQRQCLEQLVQISKIDLDDSSSDLTEKLKELFQYHKALKNYQSLIQKINESIDKRCYSIDQIVQMLVNGNSGSVIRLVIGGIFSSASKRAFDAAMSRANLVLNDDFVQNTQTSIDILNNPTKFHIDFDVKTASSDFEFCQLLQITCPDLFKDERVTELVQKLARQKEILESMRIKDVYPYNYRYSTTIKDSVVHLSETLTYDIDNKTFADYKEQLELIYKHFYAYKQLPVLSKQINDSIDRKTNLINRIIASLNARFNLEYILNHQSVLQEIKAAVDRANFVLKDGWLDDVSNVANQLKYPQNIDCAFDKNAVLNTDFAQLFQTICPEIDKLCKDAHALLQSIKSIQGTSQLIDKIKNDVSKIRITKNHSYALTEMKKTSLDALKKAKKGFHVTALQNFGFKNLYQIFIMNEYELQNIDGVGSVMASALKDFVNQFYNSLIENSPIKLQIEKDDPEYSNLIHDVYELYKRTVFLKKYENEIPKIEQVINYLNKINNYQLCILTNRQFQNVYSRTNYLKENDLTPYCFSTVQEAWAVFEKQPILFVGTLERLCPNIFGKDDSKDIFAAELLRKIEGFELDLKNFRCQPRSYQFFGARYMLYQKKALIGDEMGLGKTIEALTALMHLWNNNKKYFVLVCPLTIVENWQREIKRFTDIPSFVYTASRGLSYHQYKSDGGIMIIPYGRDFDLHFKDMKFDACVVDEAHWIKNPNAQRTERTLSILNRSEYKFLMTGTPIENKVEDMTWLISILNPKLAAKLEQNSDISQSKAFRKLASPVYFRRTTEQVALELPELIESDEWIDLNSDERYLYEIHIINREHMAARQMSFENIMTVKSAKVQKIEEIIENAVNENRKVIIFSFFRNTLEQLKKKFGDKAMGPINGETPVTDRQTIIDHFTDGNKPILLAQILTGGTGLNIQTASVVIFCEPQYKPSIENQAIKRSHRIGQTRNVLAFHILTKNTIEERIQQRLEEKRELFREFADTSDSGLESIAIDKALQAELEQEEYENIVNNKENYQKAIEELKKMEADDNRVSDANPTQDSKDKERNKMTDKLRWQILLRDGCTCQVCGASTKTDKNIKLEVDHIIPISKGGRTVPANLQTLCHKCNMGKMTDTYDAKG